MYNIFDYLFCVEKGNDSPGKWMNESCYMSYVDM